MAFLPILPLAGMAKGAVGLLSQHPELVSNLAPHLAIHAIGSYLFRSSSRRGFSRRQLRRAANMRRRKFIDTVIMQHLRLHDRNRKKIIMSARERVLKKKNPIQRILERQSPYQDNLNRNRNADRRDDFRMKALRVRGYMDARSMRNRIIILKKMRENEGFA